MKRLAVLLVLVCAACASSSHTGYHAVPDVPTTSTTATPGTSASQGAVAWVVGHPSFVTKDCALAKKGLDQGVVTAEQIVTAMRNSLSTQGVNVDDVIGVVATRCPDPKTGAALLVALARP